MYVYSPMLPEDILSLDLTNLDSKTENFTFGYYMEYFMNHTSDFFTARRFQDVCIPSTNMIYTNPIVGYLFGKKQLKEKLCYHLSGLSVAPFSRKHGIGSILMKLFETTGNSYNAWFVDLYVRESNKIAIDFYHRNGYLFYRKVIRYYWYPVENALDMRKSLSIDTHKFMSKPGKDIDAAYLNE